MERALDDDATAEWGELWDQQLARDPGWQDHCGSLSRLDAFRSWLNSRPERRIACVSHFGAINNLLNGEPWAERAAVGGVSKWGYRGLSPGATDRAPKAAMRFELPNGGWIALVLAAGGARDELGLR